MLSLDIWAGCTWFASQLRKLNPQINTSFIWEPDWKNAQARNIIWYLQNNFAVRFWKILSQKDIEGVLENSKSGVFRILAKYWWIPLPNESMDVITLNSPYPRFSLFWDQGLDEIQRVLKRWGVFYFWHSAKIWEVSEESTWLQEVAEWNFDMQNHKRATVNLNGNHFIFPMSSTIEQNLLYLTMARKGIITNPSEKGRVYTAFHHPCKIPISPSWKIYQKI